MNVSCYNHWRGNAVKGLFTLWLHMFITLDLPIILDGNLIVTIKRLRMWFSNYVQRNLKMPFHH
jgi:hypothetical protein